MPNLQAPVVGGTWDDSLKDLADDCNKSVNKKKACPPKPSGTECTRLGTLKHTCCQKAIEDYKKNNPGATIQSEVRSADGVFRGDVVFMSSPPPPPLAKKDSRISGTPCDFKFNCGGEGKMSDRQKTKYKKYTSREVRVVHSDGSKCP